MQSQSRLPSTTRLGADERSGSCGCSPKLVRATIHAIVPEFCCGQTIGGCCCNQMQATVGQASTPATRIGEGQTTVEKIDCPTQTRDTGIISASELHSLCQGLRAVGFKESDDNLTLAPNPNYESGGVGTRDSPEIIDVYGGGPVRRQSKANRLCCGRQTNFDTIAEDSEYGNYPASRNTSNQSNLNREGYGQNRCRPQCKMNKVSKKKKNKASPPSMHDIALSSNDVSCQRICGGNKSMQTSQSLYSDGGGCCEHSKCGCHDKRKKQKVKNKKTKKKKKKKEVCPHCKHCERKKGCTIM